MSDVLKKSIIIFSLLLLPLYLMINNSAIEDVCLKKQTDSQIINLLKSNEITGDIEDLHGYKVSLLEEKENEGEEGKQQYIELKKGEKIHIWVNKITKEKSSALDGDNIKVVIANNKDTSYELSSKDKLTPLMASGILYIVYLIFLYKIVFERKVKFFSILNYGTMYFFFFSVIPFFVEAIAYPAKADTFFTDKNIKMILWNGFLVVVFLNYSMGSILNSLYQKEKELEKEN